MSTAQSKQIGRVYSLGLETEIEPIRAFPTVCGRGVFVELEGANVHAVAIVAGNERSVSLIGR